MKNKIEIHDLNTNNCIENLTEEELTLVSGGIVIVIEGVVEAGYELGKRFGCWLRRIF